MGRKEESRKTTPEAQTDLVARLLAFEMRSAVTSEERADAAARLFDKTFAVLSPVIGGAGVEAIFERSVRLTRRDFPCLDLVRSTQAGKPVDPRQCLVPCQQWNERVQYESVATALYAQFFALMGTLIGEALAARLILTAWPGMTEPSGQEKGNEE
jgi:hypothetical protein